MAPSKHTKRVEEERRKAAASGGVSGSVVAGEDESAGSGRGTDAVDGDGPAREVGTAGNFAQGGGSVRRNDDTVPSVKLPSKKKEKEASTFRLLLEVLKGFLDWLKGQ